MPKYKPLGYMAAKATDKKSGRMRFATNAEVATGTADDLAVSVDDANDLVAPAATTTTAGVVTLTDNSSPIATKAYADALAIAGAPVADETTAGILEVSNNAEALAVTVDNKIMTPLKVGAVLAAPPAIGSGTPAGGAFTTLSASGAFSLAGDQVQISEGGTGATSAANARTALGVAIGSDVQAYDAGLADIAGLAVTNGNIIVGDGANWVAESGATARTSLGVSIGSDVQAWNQKLDDVAGLAVTDGNIIVGDGANFVAESGATARTSLGLAIGVDVQAYDAGLADIAGLAVTDGNIIVGDGANWVAESGATARTSLGLSIGSDVQAYDAGLADIAGLAVTDGNIIVGDGANWVAESGATARTSLGLSIGSDVQAYDAGLADIAGLAVTDGNFIVGDGANWVAESAATARTSLGFDAIIQTASVTVSTGELLALATTPKTLVAAPGADKYIEFMGAQFILNYNSVPYTEAGDNFAVKYTDASGVQVSSTVESTGFIDQTADTMTNAIPAQDAIVAASGCVNQALVLDNLGSNFAAGNSEMFVQVRYRVVTAGL